MGSNCSKKRLKHFRFIFMNHWGVMNFDFLKKKKIKEYEQRKV